MRGITVITLLAATLLAVSARSAVAQPLDSNPPTTSTTTAPAASATHGTGLGLGVAAMLRGPAGISVAYDAGAWHLDSMLGLAKNNFGGVPENRPVFGLGARFWFHVHRAANADFSVGGGLGFIHNGPAGNTDTLSVEAGGQLRAFIVSNVAISVSAGLGIDALDRSGFGLGGQFIGDAAIHYYFY